MNESADFGRSLAEAKMADAQWQARVDLAAVYRLLEHYGYSDLIYNHAAMRVPGRPDRFLMKRHDLLYFEVTASNLVEVGMNEDLGESAGVNRPGFVLHSGVMRARPEINCTIHVHTEIGVTISAMKGGLRQLSLHAARFYGRLGYLPFSGNNDGKDEQRAQIEALGLNCAMILENHGLLTVGQTPREAMTLLRELIAAARTQVLMESTGVELLEIPSEASRRAAEASKLHDAGRGNSDWPAYLRLLDRIDPGYRF